MVMNLERLNLLFKLFKCSIANFISLTLLLTILEVRMWLELTSNIHETRPLLKPLLRSLSLIPNAFLVVGVLGKLNILPSQALTIYPLIFENPLNSPYKLLINDSDASSNNF